MIYVWVWLGALILFVVVEAMTIGLMSIWFAFGALAALIGTLLGAGLWLQLVLFIGVTALTVLFTRPLAKKCLAPKYKRTNADRVIDMIGIVTERIDNIAGTGSVHVGGREWMARSENGEIIDEGKRVNAVRIEGVKLIVAPQELPAAVQRA